MSSVNLSNRTVTPIGTVSKPSPKSRRTWWIKAGVGLIYFLLAVGSIIMVMPLVWMLSTASKPLEETLVPEFYLIPQKFSLFQNIHEAFTVVPMGLYFRNSIFVSVLVTVGRVILCAMAGYSFAKFTYPGRNQLFALVLSTMMIPFYVVVIPLYIVVYSLGWLNTLTALIIPGFVTAFGIFLMRQFMLGVPTELIDAARIDGASEPHIFWGIVLPLTKPALATLSILTFITIWDDYVWPLLVITDSELLTIPLGLSLFRDEYVTSYNLLMAAALIGLIPTYALFLFFQRQFVEGVTLSGIKG